MRNRVLVIYRFASLAVAAGAIAGCATSSSPAVGSSQGASQDGLSCQTRIKVNDVPSEYAWVKNHYPGSQVDMQSLGSCDKSPTDQLHLTTSDGKKVTVFFDISAFFGN